MIRMLSFGTVEGALMWQLLSMKSLVSTGHRASALVWLALLILIAVNVELALQIGVLLVSVVGMQATGFPLVFAITLIV